MDTNHYGQFTDPYLIARNKKNPHSLDLTEDGKIVNEEDARPRVVVPIHYVFDSWPNQFNSVPELGLTNSSGLLQYCPKGCPGANDACEAKKCGESPVRGDITEGPTDGKKDLVQPCDGTRPCDGADAKKDEPRVDVAIVGEWNDKSESGLSALLEKFGLSSGDDKNRQSGDTSGSN